MALLVRPTVGLALGGGAARGLSHIGVLEAFEEYGLPVDVIAGTSMGAMVGAMYAANPRATAVRQRFLDYLQSDAFKNSRFDYLMNYPQENIGFFDRLSQLARKSVFYTLIMTRTAFIGEEASQQNFALLIDDMDLSGTRIPFCTTALDLVSAREYVFRDGPLREAVAASCAIPGLLPPVQREGRYLIDGGWINAVPVAAARSLGAEVVIGVDVYSDLDPFIPPETAVDVAARAEAVTRWNLTTRMAQAADCLLQPESGISHWADFSQFEAAVASGREEVRRQLPRLRKLMRKRLRFDGISKRFLAPGKAFANSSR